MRSTEPRIALLGCGNWGLNHARVWHELDCLRLAIDPDPTRLAIVRERFPGVDTSLSAEDAFERDDVDGIVIATPAGTHAELALHALEVGKDVLVEKPMAVSLVEAQKVADVAAANGSVVMVNHVLEYHPAVRRLMELIAEGTLGKVLYVYSQRLNLGRVRTEENALWSFAPHDIALLLHLLDTLPTHVACQGGAYLNRDVADVTMMNLEFPGGVQAHVFVSWLHPFKQQRFVVVGDHQMAVLDDTNPWEEKLVLYPHRIDWLEGRIPVARKAEGVPVRLEEAEPLMAACRHFLECMRTRSTPETDAESGLRVLQVLEAGGRSLEQGGVPIALNDFGPMVRIHPTATVDPGAIIGPGTRVWHYTHVMDQVEIGRDCVLGQNVFVGRGVRIGNGVKIQNNVSVYEGVELEESVFCGPSVVFTNVINPRSEIERKDVFKPTMVRRGATIGANSTIVCGVTIGRHAFVGAGAVVTRDVPDHALVVGVPARLTGWACQCGERLAFADRGAVCGTCDREYEHTEAGVVQVARSEVS